MIGKRTQAYFVGFIIGIAIVSVLIDSRRQRKIEAEIPMFTWEKMVIVKDELPPELTAIRGKPGYVTGVRELNKMGEATGRFGYYFANSDGERLWFASDGSDTKLYSGEILEVHSRPGLEADLMRSGFEHQGHEVISDPSLAPFYHIRIDVSSAMEWVDAVDNLLSKRNYIESVDWVESESLNYAPILG